ncbi:unnamed protein product, partial [Amoebophrya sp. A120]|eukprot:GSA120T00025394001.1
MRAVTHAFLTAAVYLFTATCILHFAGAATPQPGSPGVTSQHDEAPAPAPDFFVAQTLEDVRRLRLSAQNQSFLASDRARKSVLDVYQEKILSRSVVELRMTKTLHDTLYGMEADLRAFRTLMREPATGGGGPCSVQQHSPGAAAHGFGAAFLRPNCTNGPGCRRSIDGISDVGELCPSRKAVFDKRYRELKAKYCKVFYGANYMVRGTSSSSNSMPLDKNIHQCPKTPNVSAKDDEQHLRQAAPTSPRQNNSSSPRIFQFFADSWTSCGLFRELVYTKLGLFLTPNAGHAQMTQFARDQARACHRVAPPVAEGELWREEDVEGGVASKDSDVRS